MKREKVKTDVEKIKMRSLNNVIKNYSNRFDKEI